MTIRPATPGDAADLGRIQGECPEAAQWPVQDYLKHLVLVAEDGQSVRGFVVFYQMTGTEFELITLAVEKVSRRLGVGRRMLESGLQKWQGRHFLEVRESNQQAIKLYESLGFMEIGRRPGYYRDPEESAIVMQRQQ